MNQGLGSMIMSGQQGMSGAGIAAAITQPQIAGLVGQIEARLKGLAEISQRIDGAVGRLLNPTPENPTKDGPGVPPSISIEGRLQTIVNSLDALISCNSKQADRLDSAV